MIDVSIPFRHKTDTRHFLLHPDSNFASNINSKQRKMILEQSCRFLRLDERDPFISVEAQRLGKKGRDERSARKQTIISWVLRVTDF